MRGRLSAAETSEATSSRLERCLNCALALRRERRRARVRSRRNGSFNFKRDSLPHTKTRCRGVERGRGTVPINRIVL